MNISMTPFPEEKYRFCFRKAKKLLETELLDHRKKGRAVAGAGPCLACEECAAEADGGRCGKPAKRIYSLESLGVNITGLAKRCFNIDLEWSCKETFADFVCALGAVFLAAES